MSSHGDHGGGVGGLQQIGADARVLGTDRFVWWPAREGTYIRESKNAVASFERMIR